MDIFQGMSAVFICDVGTLDLREMVMAKQQLSQRGRR